jgi:hypothetical protein
MREWLARAIQAKRKLPVVRRVLAKRCNWGWRAWTWIQKDPVRAGLMDCGFMGIGLALTVHLSQQFPSSVWLFAGGLAHAKFRLARQHSSGHAMPGTARIGMKGLRCRLQWSLE